MLDVYWSYEEYTKWLDDLMLLTKMCLRNLMTPSPLCTTSSPKKWKNRVCNLDDAPTQNCLPLDCLPVCNSEVGNYRTGINANLLFGTMLLLQSYKYTWTKLLFCCVLGIFYSSFHWDDVCGKYDLHFEYGSDTKETQDVVCGCICFWLCDVCAILSHYT